MYPDFLGIGAQKSGTTWLYDNLKCHPQIWLPPVKELHYLDHDPPSLGKRLFGRAQHQRKARFHLRQSFYAALRGDGADRLAWAARYCLASRDDSWYASLFPKIDGLMPGEVCPGYARLDVGRVGHVKGLMPKAKIIYLLRNPVERAWSALAMHFRAHHGGAQNITEEAIVARLEKPKSARHGEYLRNLAAWETHYPADQILIGFFDELQGDPAALWRRVCGFLGVDEGVASTPNEVAERRNPGRGESPQSQFESLLARAYEQEVEGLHAKFANDYTRSWVSFVKARC